MPAHRLVSDQQLEILVAFMEKNRDLAVGKVTNASPNVKRQIKSRWELLAAQLNNVGSGISRTPLKWKVYWNERKYSVRKRARGRDQHVKGIGRLPPWDPMDERIMTILGKVAVFGNPSVKIPFNGTTKNLKTTSFTEHPTPPPPPSLHELTEFSKENSSPPQPAFVKCQPAPIPPERVLPTSKAPITSTSSVADTSTIEPNAPSWVLEIEERNLAAEERMSQAMETMAAGINTIAAVMSENTRAMAQIARLLERIYNVSSTNQ